MYITSNKRDERVNQEVFSTKCILILIPTNNSKKTILAPSRKRTKSTGVSRIVTKENRIVVVHLYTYHQQHNSDLPSCCHSHLAGNVTGNFLVVHVLYS